MSEETKGLRDQSRVDYKGAINIENINAGSLQRIADACEVMARDRVKLEHDVKNYRELYLNKVKEVERLEKSIIGLKGVIGKLKKKNSDARIVTK